MNINNAFPSKYIKSGDINPDADMVLTISHVEVENVGQGDEAELKPVVYFSETDKGLVLNKTNAATIAKLVGTPETEGWTGKRIALFATEVDFAGKQTLAIRVRMRAPNGNGSTPAQLDRDAALKRFQLAGLALRDGIEKMKANNCAQADIDQFSNDLVAYRIDTKPLDAATLNQKATELEAFVAAAAKQVPEVLPF